MFGAKLHTSVKAALFFFDCGVLHLGTQKGLVFMIIKTGELLLVFERSVLHNSYAAFVSSLCYAALPQEAATSWSFYNCKAVVRQLAYSSF